MAKRALKRLNGEDVFGNRISVSEKTADDINQTSPKKRRAITGADDPKGLSSSTYASALTKGKMVSTSFINGPLIIMPSSLAHCIAPL